MAEVKAIVVVVPVAQPVVEAALGVVPLLREAVDVLVDVLGQADHVEDTRPGWVVLALPIGLGSIGNV